MSETKRVWTLKPVLGIFAVGIMLGAVLASVIILPRFRILEIEREALQRALDARVLNGSERYEDELRTIQDFLLWLRAELRVLDSAFPVPDPDGVSGG